MYILIFQSHLDDSSGHRGEYQHKHLGDRPLGAFTLASGRRYACVGHAVTDRDIQQKVLHYISGKDIFGVESCRAQKKRSIPQL